MPKLSYEVTHRLEKHTTNKLINFINTQVHIDDILKEINYEYPFFLDDSNRVGFKVWLSIDFVDNDGKTYIDRLLESKVQLSSLERELLSQKNKSFVSLFEIIDFQDDHMVLLDILQNQEFLVWEPHMNDVLTIGEFLFTRIGKVVEEYSFIGEISYLPESVKSMFMDNFLVNYNEKRKNNSNLMIMDYLKKYSLELYKNYNNCILNAIEIDEELSSYLYDELDEFEGYLKTKTKGSKIGKHISNLIEFFEYYLSQEDLTLYDLDQLDFKFFFKEAIKDGFINSQEDFNSYISTFKRYMSFLSNRDEGYKEAYLELLDISENRFSYMEKLKNFNTPFTIDRLLGEFISENLNDTAIEVLINFDKFILYTVDKQLELTPKKQEIKRKHLLELTELFKNNTIFSNERSNQSILPLIDLIFKVSVRLGLTYIENNKLILTRKGTNFIRLKDDDKFTLIFLGVWNKDFIHEATNIDVNMVDITMRSFVNLSILLNENKSYSVKYIITEFKYDPENLFQINEYLKILGLVKSNFYPSYTWEFTKLGKIIFNYLYEKEHNLKESSIVELDMYRKSKKL